MLAFLRTLVFLFILAQIALAVVPEGDLLDTVMRFLRPLYEEAYQYLPDKVTLYMASTVLHFLLGVPRRLSTGGGRRLRYLTPVRAKSVTPGSAHFSVEGELQPYRTSDTFTAALSDFALAQTAGWLPKVVCGLAAAGIFAYFMSTDQSAAALLALVPLIALILLFLGRLRVEVASGHVASYYGFRCAEKLEEVSAVDRAECLRVRERSVFVRQDAMLNLPQASALIVGRRLPWLWLVLGACLIGLPFAYRPPGLPPQAGEVWHYIPYAGAGVIVVSLLAALWPTLVLEFPGGGAVRIRRRRNIRRVLELKDEVEEATWTEIRRLGLFGYVRYFLRDESLALQARKSQVHVGLILLGLGGIGVGINYHNPGCIIGGILVVAVAIFLSIPRTSYYLLGGWEHRFRRVEES